MVCDMAVRYHLKSHSNGMGYYTVPVANQAYIGSSLAILGLTRHLVRAQPHTICNGMVFPLHFYPKNPLLHVFATHDTFPNRP